MEQLIPQPFNAAQIELISSMAQLHTEDDLRELKQALTMFFSARADQEMQRLWDEGFISERTIEQWGKEHMRTPYK